MASAVQDGRDTTIAFVDGPVQGGAGETFLWLLDYGPGGTNLPDDVNVVAGSVVLSTSSLDPVLSISYARSGVGTLEYVSGGFVPDFVTPVPWP